MICKICNKRIIHGKFMWANNDYHIKCWDKMKIDFTNNEKTPMEQAQEYFIKHGIK